MSDNSIRIGAGYPLGQLARALTTAQAHEDAASRQRAELRVRRWQQVVAGMAHGRLDIGSRIPVKGLPAWMTPEVVHGGFATGEPAASGPLRTDEADRAQRLGLPADRRRGTARSPRMAGAHPARRPGRTPLARKAGGGAKLARGRAEDAWVDDAAVTSH